MHLKPAGRLAAPGGRTIVDHLFPPGRLGRIPIVGIAGGAAHPPDRAPGGTCCSSAGHVGLACREGLFPRPGVDGSAKAN